MMARDPIRWVRLFPELALFDSAEVRRKAIREAHELSYKPLLRNLIAAAIGAGCVAGVAAIIYDQLLRSSLSLPRWWTGAICGVLGGVASALIVNRMLRTPIRRCLREQLNAAGKPVCIKCGYDLRAVSEPRCPECGLKFGPRLITGPPPTE